ncbi:MAG: DUF5678 domain-containing protein [Chloroflexota bacterium]|nr:DUF5678 domain-containing protein [Chloroflexota bacterium]
MGVQIHLSVPDKVYQQAAQVAQRTNRSIEDVLTDTLVRAFPPLHVHAKRDQMQQEEAAFEALHPTLLERYPDEYVAIHGGAVVDHDRDEIALVQRLDAHYPQQVVLIRQVRPEGPPPLHFRSPRFLSDE